MNLLILTGCLFLGLLTAESSRQVSRKAALPAGLIFLRINQLGFRPLEYKSAIAISREALPPVFMLVDSRTGKEVYQATTRPIPGEWGELRYHGELEFSSLHTPGSYAVKWGDQLVPAPPILVGPDIYRDLPNQLLEFMRHQRCGYNPWLDVVCHRHDARTAYGPKAEGSFLDARGGWHDAADLLKYLLTSSNATAQLLMAYRLNPGMFTDQVNAQGQPMPNGIPDVLDEARWGLEWMLRLHPEPDQLYHQVADDRDHSGWRLPQNDTSDYGWGPGKYRVVYHADGRPQGLRKYQSASTGVANLAGRYAAAMALAYQIWRRIPGHEAFAERCLQAGREVYQLGRRQEGVQQGNSYGAPYRYAEETWADDMEWGAAELHRATGIAAYLEDAKRFARLIGSTSWMGSADAGHYQFYPFMNLGHYALYDQVEEPVQRQLMGYYQAGIERCLTMGQGNPYRIGVPFIWCSNNLVVALATQCLLYDRMTKDDRYLRVAAGHRDWLLGCNAWGTSMFTGIPEGGSFPRYPHLMTTKLTGRSVRGGLVDGPVYERIFQSLRGVALSRPDELAPFQSKLAVYHDDVMDYATNEPTMDGTASAILLFALVQASRVSNTEH